ncbi:MAG: metalloprotease TldD [Legionellaceae bacterium]|nr:metalloprotease TldD [Legionellaceae bacterium]
MRDNLTIAKELLLSPADIDQQAIDKVMGAMLNAPLDDADLYFQSGFYESWHLEDAQVKSGSYSIDRGVGIRAVSDDKTGFAYSDDLMLPAMLRAANAAKAIAVSKSNSVYSVHAPAPATRHYAALNPIDTMTKAEKIALLEAIDKEARSLDSRVIQVNASLNSSYEAIVIAGMHQEMVADIRPLVSIHITIMVEDKKGRRESARSGGGGRVALGWFAQKDRALQFTREAVREALINLEAEEAPAGTMPVVLGPGWPGVLLHEAVGHGLEGDFNRKGLSAFSGKMGEQVAAKGVTVVDDGTLSDRRGSLSMDDEGTPTQCTTLIEDGVLVNYMQDKLNARLMGMQVTGNCRRESYAHVPMPRMTNTYMLAGQYHPEEIIRSVKKGLYAVNFGGGQVDITSGQFVFSASEAYLIEDGKITRPVKGATLIGNGPDVMKKVSMIGHDLALDSGIGVCGKAGQSVPVGVGQPTIKIDALTVGGTKSQPE